MSYEPVCAFCTAEGATRCHSIRDRSSAYSYARVYSSRSGPASSTNRTWLAYPSSYSSRISASRRAPVHSGYLAKSQMTSATCETLAPITIDWDDEPAESAMLRRLPERGAHPRVIDPHRRRARRDRRRAAAARTVTTTSAQSTVCCGQKRRCVPPDPPRERKSVV